MDLLKHTFTRLISIPAILQQLPSQNCKAHLLYKVGADGASSQSEYKLKMEGGSSDGDNDKSIFAATMTILGLVIDGSFIDEVRVELRTITEVIVILKLV